MGWTRAGVVQRAHGIRGELRLLVDAAGLIAAGQQLQVRCKDGSVMLTTLTQVRGGGGQSLLGRFAKIDDRDAAQRLAGAHIDIRACDIPPTGPKEFYIYELAQAQVFDMGGDACPSPRLIGVVAHVADNNGQALLMIDSPQGERLLPLVPALIERFDRLGKALYMRVPAGLWADDGL